MLEQLNKYKKEKLNYFKFYYSLQHVFIPSRNRNNRVKFSRYYKRKQRKVGGKKKWTHYST